jgi:AcrR family transcriptional regulator
MPAPTKLRPRTKPAETRRDELMNAAQHLFLVGGFESTTIEQITTAADVAKGTFYLYFSSKEEVRAALVGRFAEDLLAKIEAAIARRRDGDWRGKMSAWAAAGLAAYFDSIRLHDALFYGAHPPSPDGRVDNIIIDHLIELLQAGAVAGAWSIGDPRLTAVFLFSGLHGVVEHAHVREKRTDRTELAQELERLCLRAVGPAG